MYDTTPEIGLVLVRHIAVVLLRCLEGFVPVQRCTNDTVTGGMFSHIHENVSEEGWCSPYRKITYDVSKVEGDY